MNSIQITAANAPAFHMSDEEVLASRPHGTGGALTLTRDLCRALGWDAANQHMDKHSLKPWSEEAFNVGVEVTWRYLVFGGFFPPELYEREIGQPFPYERDSTGKWQERRTKGRDSEGCDHRTNNRGD
jgi:hypothetical protein